MALLYTVGGGFYVSRIPQKWKPGAFDIAGHSHQVFHVFVVPAALVHSAAIIFIPEFCRGSPVCMLVIFETSIEIDDTHKDRAFSFIQKHTTSVHKHELIMGKVFLSRRAF